MHNRTPHADPIDPARGIAWALALSPLAWALAVALVWVGMRAAAL